MGLNSLPGIKIWFVFGVVGGAVFPPWNGRFVSLCLESRDGAAFPPWNKNLVLVWGRWRRCHRSLEWHIWSAFGVVRVLSSLTGMVDLVNF